MPELHKTLILLPLAGLALAGYYQHREKRGYITTQTMTHELAK